MFFDVDRVRLQIDARLHVMATAMTLLMSQVEIELHWMNRMNKMNYDYDVDFFILDVLDYTITWKFINY